MGILNSATWSSVISVFNTIRLLDVVDILIVAYLFYQLIKLVKQTRAKQLIKGVLLLFVINFIATQLNLTALQSLIRIVLNYGAFAVIVVFQPELRRALEKIGRTQLNSIFKAPSTSDDYVTLWSRAIAAVCDGVNRLSESKTGALIVFERLTPLGDIIRTGTELDAAASPEIIGNIFFKNSPLHDGAAVIRDGRVKAAGCLLPLSDNIEISKDMGTRHRAALGMSENSDAVIVVVSEETGIISLAQNGSIIRRLNRQHLHKLLTDEIIGDADKNGEEVSLGGWFKKGGRK